MAPFPYLPMTAVMASLLSMQIAELTLFSYVGYMLEYLGVVDDKDEAGYYAGFLASGFMIGTLLSSRFWGLVADRHGSRSVITCGLLSISIVSVAFGSAKNFTWAFVCRLLLGLFNGMETAAKTIVTDVCGTEHNTVCMGLLTSSWSLGSVLGPGVGGMLAEPARRFPQSFSEEGLFGRNPYLLSNVVGAGLALLALPLVFLFLKDIKGAQNSSSTTKGWLSSWWCCNRKGGGRGGDDTKEGCEPRHAPGARAESSVAFGENSIRKQSWKQPETMPLTLKWTGPGRDAEEVGKQASGVKKESLLAQRHIRVLLFMDAIFSASFSGFDEVYALWAVSSTAKGGLDWSSSHVGQVFVACDLMVLAFELLAVPYLTPWLGVQTSQRLGSVFEVPVYVLFPLLSLVNNTGFPVTVPVLILLFTSYVCTNSFYVAIAMAVNTATGPDRRGEINGLSMTCTSLARAISAIVFSSLFAFSVNSNHTYPFDYHLAFYLVALTRLVVTWLGWSRIRDVVNMEGHGYMYQGRE